jgi:hypothetical protein
MREGKDKRIYMSGKGIDAINRKPANSSGHIINLGSAMFKLCGYEAKEQI